MGCWLEAALYKAKVGSWGGGTIQGEGDLDERYGEGGGEYGWVGRLSKVESRSSKASALTPSGR